MRVISFESLLSVSCLNGDEHRGQWQQSVISKWQISNERVPHLPLCSGREKEVGSVMCNVAGQTRESGFALAGNGYLRSWKWSGPFWHFHSPEGKSNLQQKTERLKQPRGRRRTWESQSERWGRKQGKWLHARVKKWLELNLEKRQREGNEDGQK